VLGFMTKFVAALFLPFVLVVASAILGDYRRRVLREWRLWLGVGALALALIAPWFVYATLRVGRIVWGLMLRDHVYPRFTRSLDPTHVQPWYFYWTSVYQSFMYAGSQVIIIAGLAAIAVKTIGWRWKEGAVILLWFFLPLTLISFGTSKLIHYAYPFLP